MRKEHEQELSLLGNLRSTYMVSEIKELLNVKNKCDIFLIRMKYYLLNVELDCKIDNTWYRIFVLDSLKNGKNLPNEVSITGLRKL